MTDLTSTDQVVAELGETGVELSIDDLGTDHSSLAKLRSPPITEVEMDKAFITSMLEQNNDATIVRSPVELAHNLGLRRQRDTRPGRSGAPAPPACAPGATA